MALNKLSLTILGASEGMVACPFCHHTAKVEIKDKTVTYHGDVVIGLRCYGCRSNFSLIIQESPWGVELAAHERE